MSIKQINDAKDILALQNGDFVSKHSLYNIIIFSKNPFSINYLGPEYEIKNSPQQGINWIGSDYKPKAVLVKSKFGCYYQDSHNEYAFKARNGYVNKFEKANQVLVNQPRYKYPIMYFKEWGDSWRFLGRFKVVEIKDRSVVLSPFEGEEEVCELNKENNISQLQELEKDEKEWCELTKKNIYINHLCRKKMIRLWKLRKYA
ncbi:MAG: hypothetical protein J6X11_12260 [Treponema sp.]|nr:hypothetical protein [Treponema sp.]